MNSILRSFSLLCVGLFMFGCCTCGDSFPELRGPYLGQEPPGMEGELFAPGIMSTGMYELNAVFFPGGKEVIWSVMVGQMRWALVMMREENGRWTRPEPAPFSGRFGGVDPFVSHDGNTVYYCSDRPRSGGSEPEDNYDIWFVERTETGWADPINMGPPINSDAHEFYPSMTREGTMYFQSHREGGIGSADIYRSERVDDRYEKAVLLPEPVNSPGFEGDTLIAPDESYLIVSTHREGDSFGQSDLYISFREEGGSWSSLMNLSDRVNSDRGENCQILSPCGKYLFYTSRRYRPFDGIPPTYYAIKRAWASPQNGGGDLYWVDAKIIDSLKPDGLN
ncbi:MAG: TolB-like translocation protein [Planctomycetota bacterium]